MTEEEARGWVADRFGAASVDRMTRFTAMLRDASAHQNLVSATTFDTVWSRHIVDSAQLISLASAQSGLWLDIGTGAGFPGLIVAALTEREVVLVEPRRRRVEFLQECCSKLAISGRTRVLLAKVERATAKADVITARAVAPLLDLFAAAHHCSTWNTLWLLPKGQSAEEEIVSAKSAWHGRFHVERSVTNAQSMIVVAKEVSRR